MERWPGPKEEQEEEDVRGPSPDSIVFCFVLFYITSHTFSRARAGDWASWPVHSSFSWASSPGQAFQHRRVLPRRGDPTELGLSPAGKISDCQVDLLLTRRTEFKWWLMRWQVKRARKGTAFCSPGQRYSWRKDSWVVWEVLGGLWAPFAPDNGHTLCTFSFGCFLLLVSAARYPGLGS